MRAKLLLLLVVTSGCIQKAPQTHYPIVGCEYYFDHRGVTGYYWMNGAPHKDLDIRACYDIRGSRVKLS